MPTRRFPAHSPSREPAPSLPGSHVPDGRGRLQPFLTLNPSPSLTQPVLPHLKPWSPLQKVTSGFHVDRVLVPCPQPLSPSPTLPAPRPLFSSPRPRTFSPLSPPLPSDARLPSSSIAQRPSQTPPASRVRQGLHPDQVRWFSDVLAGGTQLEGF